MSDPRIPAELKIEIATLARDITAPIAGFTLSTRDDILTRRGGGEGLRIYQDLARDGHAGSVLRKRRQAVVAREWTVDPASEAPADLQAAMLVRAALKRVEFDRACQGLLTAVLTGIAVAEVLWEAAEITLEDGTSRTWIVPADIRVRNPRRFVFDRERQLRLLTWDHPTDGVALPERKFLRMGFWAEENEDPYGRGLGHDLFWPVYFKRNAIALWNALIEKFGMPFVYAEYPQGTPQGDRIALSQTLQDMARGAGLVVPQGTLIKFLEAGAGGSATGSLHADLKKAMDEEISKIVLGETLTTTMGAVGSRAASETHDGVRRELADQDADLLSGRLNATLLRWITEINLPGARPPTIDRPANEQPDLKARSELDERLFKVGFEPTEDYIAETYGPGYRRIQSRPPGGAQQPRPGMPTPAEFAAAAVSPPAPERVAAMLAREAEGAQQAMLAAFQAEVNAASSFDDLDERLLRLAAVMPIGPLAEMMAQAIAVAGLAGQADVQDMADAAR